MTKGKIYKGKSVLKLPVGSILRVVEIGGEEYNESGDEDSIIMKIDNAKSPFVEITEPAIWGNEVKDYTFEYIDHILNIIHGERKDI